MSATSLAVIGSRPVGLAVLARVAVVGADGGDALGRGPLGRVDHDQLLHERVVDRAAVGLDDEDVAAPDRHVVAAVDLAVGELAQVGLARARRRGGRRSPRPGPGGSGRTPAPGAAGESAPQGATLPLVALGRPRATAGAVRRVRSAASGRRAERRDHRTLGDDRAGSEADEGADPGPGADRPRRCSRCWRTSARSPTTVSTSVAAGPISAPSPTTRVAPQDDPREAATTSAASCTSAST